MLSCGLVLKMAAMYIFPTSKFQIRIKLKILTQLSKVVFVCFKWLKGSQLQSLSFSDPRVNSKWTSLKVYINTYSEKYISTRLHYTSIAFSSKWHMYRVKPTAPFCLHSLA